MAVEVDVIMMVSLRPERLLLLLLGLLRRGRLELAADRRDADRGPAEQGGAGGDDERGESG
jgi:hypothetical protein